MRMPSIINQTATYCAIGYAKGAAYGALINPVMGVEAGAVLGAVALPVASLVFIPMSSPFFACVQLSDRIVDKIETPWVKTIAKISFEFAGVVVGLSAFTVSGYAGLYAGKYALAALGFKATIAPSLSLAAKFFLAHFASDVGVDLAISSVKALWNRTIINQTAINCAKGAAYGAAYGALINPVIGVVAGAVLGAVAIPASFLVTKAIDPWKPPLWMMTNFDRVVFDLITITVSAYSGIYAGKYALAALGFKATIAPSLSLAAKFFLASFACDKGVNWTISSVKAL